MSPDPVVQPGQLSPDGLWRWDGTRWVSTTPGFAPTPAPRRSRSWIWWLVGGCAVLLIIGTIGVGFGVYTLVTRFQNGAFSCLPADFPNYPRASVISENTTTEAGLPSGDSRRCNMVLDSNDSVAAVTTFYQAQLNNGDWTITSSDSSNDVIHFQRKSRPQTVGTLTVLGRGQYSEVQIQLDS